MGALAVLLIITSLLVVLGFKGRIALVTPHGGIRFLEPSGGWSRSALKWFKGLGIPLFILACLATVFQTLPTDIYLVTITASEGTQIEIPVESRPVPGLPTEVRPVSVAELTEQWADLSTEERKAGTLKISSELPDDTLVTYKPSGSQTFIEALWGDLTSDDQKEVIDIITAPDTDLDLKVHLPEHLPQLE